MKRSAFTLVELLVVVSIIAILAAILLVAINGARESARRNQCLTRQRDLALAMNVYNTENNGLPGSLNQFGSTPIHSWVVSILPMIGENKRYEVLMEKGSDVASAVVPLPAVLCPSVDIPEIFVPFLNYFANCGPHNAQSQTAPHNPDFVLFKDRRTDLTAHNSKVKIEEIPDGTTNTILLLEDIGINQHRGFWHSLPGTSWSDSSFNLNEYNIGSESTRSIGVVDYLGFVWAGDAAFPYSAHIATGNAAFADGSARPINSDISKTEYLRLVCPDDAKAKTELSLPL